MMTDPIADLLTRIGNAARAKHPRLDVPASKLKIEIARILKEEGYLSTYKLLDESKVRKTLRLFLKYTPDKCSVITGLRRVSKPGLRVYSQSTKVPRVLGGLGVAVLSTSQGLMTDREARKRNVGGEILCFVW